MYLALRFFCVVFHFAMYLAYDLGFHIILCSSVFSGLVVDTCLPTAGHGEGWPRDGRLRPAGGGGAWHPGDVGRRRPTTEDGDGGPTAAAKTGDGGSGWRFVPFTVFPTFTFNVIIYLGTLGTFVMQ